MPANVADATRHLDVCKNKSRIEAPFGEDDDNISLHSGMLIKHFYSDGTWYSGEISRIDNEIMMCRVTYDVDGSFLGNIPFNKLRIPNNNEKRTHNRSWRGCFWSSSRGVVTI